MPFYEFRSEGGKEMVVQAPFSRCAALIAEMAAAGWEKVFSRPTTIIYPGYHEALEEAHRDEAVEERRMAVDRAEVARDLDQAVKEEFGTP